MANWCFNYIQINKKAAEKYLLVDKAGRKEVDLEKMRPMPEELLIDSGSSDGAEIIAYLTNKGRKSLLEAAVDDPVGLEAYKSSIPSWYPSVEQAFFKDLQLFREKFVTEKQIAVAVDRGKKMCENFSKYGDINWYHWRHRNWGTRSNSCDTIIENGKEDQLLIQFDTHNCPPVKILEELARNADFHIEYHIEGNGCGAMEGKYGALIDLGYANIRYEDLEAEAS